MAVASRSAKSFLERSGLIHTIRGPLPAHSNRANKAHTETLEAPLPVPEFQAITQGEPAPDRGATEEWPFGAAEE